MKLWSKGLGSMEICMDFKRYGVVKEKDEVHIKGTITEPVIWNFVITFTQDDIPGLIKIALDKRILWMFIKNFKLTITSAILTLLGKFKPQDDYLTINKPEILNN